MTWDEQIRERFPDWGTEVAAARWETDRARLYIGKTVSGEVIARAPFGVWIDINVGHPALLLVPYMAGAREDRIVFENYSALGAIVEARIATLGEGGKISLTQHELG
jgi:hypothetical protein